MLACFLAAALSAGSDVQTSAFIDADEIAVGERYEIFLRVRLPESVVASEAGAPAPFLQIDVPPSVRLEGRYLKTKDELARNEFLVEPYERLIKEELTRIPFVLEREPEPGESIGLNVVAYLTAEGEPPRFFRERLELAVTGGASGQSAARKRSDWGEDERLLQIGDEVTPVALPNAAGESVDLGQWIGKKNVIVTTYRAFW